MRISDTVCSDDMLLEYAAAHVVWTLVRHELALGSAVVTVLVRLSAFPSPFSKNANTSNSVPSASWRVKS